MAIRIKRTDFQKEMGQSWFKHMAFELFGETRIFGWFFGITVVAAVLYWGFIAFIGFHFISKYW